MKHTVGVFALLAVVALPILAQTETVDVEAQIAAAQLEFEEWVSSTKAFIKDTTFDENDLVGFIELWPDFAAIDSAEDDENIVDYRSVLADPRYKEFVSTHGLAGEPWLKKSVRIITFVMRDQMEMNLAMAEQQLPEQLRTIEEQKAHYGEEAYQNVKRAIEASGAMIKKQREVWAGMPTPTASERALLEKYNADLMTLMMSGGEDEFEEEDWEEEEEDEDWDEP